MSAAVRVIIYTSDEQYATQLRRHIVGVSGVKIVAEIDDTILLAQACERFPADIVLIDLDPMPQDILPVAGALAMERPDLNVFAVSESTDGQLILSAMRSGIVEFLTKPIDFEILSIAFEKVASRKEAGRSDGKIITVMGSAGGVGASSLACNLGVELAGLAGADRVALVDLDYRFGQVATMLDVQPSFTIADLADSAEQLDQSVVERALTHHESGVHILARPNQFAQADMITAAHCSGILNTLQGMYDYVVIDGPNRFDIGTKSILDIADVNILLIQLLVTSVRNVHRIVEEMRAIGFNMDRVKLVCNRVGKDSGIISAQYVEETLDHKIYFSLPDDWSHISGAINMGVPLSKEYGKSRIRVAIRELATLIHGPEARPAGDPVKGRGGLFSKMFPKG